MSMIYGRGPGLDPMYGLETKKFGPTAFLERRRELGAASRGEEYRRRQFQQPQNSNSPLVQQQGQPSQGYMQDENEGPTANSRREAFHRSSGNQNDDLLHRRTVTGSNADMWLGGEDPQHIARTSGLNPSPRANSYDPYQQ
jgi:hypothetical protein